MAMVARDIVRSDDPYGKRAAEIYQPAGVTGPISNASGDPQVLGGQVQQGATRQRNVS